MKKLLITCLLLFGGMSAFAWPWYGGWGCGRPWYYHHWYRPYCYPTYYAPPVVYTSPVVYTQPIVYTQPVIQQQVIQQVVQQPTTVQTVTKPAATTTTTVTTSPVQTIQYIPAQPQTVIIYR